MTTSEAAYYLAWICMIHLSVFSIILFFKKDNRKANMVLAFFMLILASIHVSHLLLLSEKIYDYHWLNEFCFLLLFFEGPLYLWYTSLMTGIPINWKKNLWLHLLPFVAPLWFMASFAFKTHAEIISYYEQAMLTQPFDATMVLAIVTLQSIVYWLWSINLLKQYNNRLRNKIYKNIMSLRWLYILTILLLLSALVLVPLLLWLIQSDISILYIYMPLITMAVYLALFYKSINFPGTEHEKKLIRELIREKISRDMHDELGAGITRIALLSETAKKGSVINDYKCFEEISGNARQLADSLKEIIWGLSPENDSFISMIAYLREYMSEYLEDAGIEYIICFPNEVPEVTVSHETRRNLSMLVKEALNNMVKHSKADKAQIALELKKSSFSFSISDNGIGFVLGTENKGNGLINMEKRVRKIGGEFYLKSAPGKGTRIQIKEIPFY